MLWHPSATLSNNLFSLLFLPQVNFPHTTTKDSKAVSKAQRDRNSECNPTKCWPPSIASIGRFGKHKSTPKFNAHSQHSIRFLPICCTRAIFSLVQLWKFTFYTYQTSTSRQVTQSKKVVIFFDRFFSLHGWFAFFCNKSCGTFLLQNKPLFSLFLSKASLQFCCYWTTEFNPWFASAT